MAATPSIPSQFASRNIRSGVSFGSPMAHSQPSAGSMFESRKPARHSYMQSPMRHCASWFGPAMQVRLHAPQFCGSFCRSMSGRTVFEHVATLFTMVHRSSVHGFVSRQSIALPIWHRCVMRLHP